MVDWKVADLVGKMAVKTVDLMVDWKVV